MKKVITSKKAIDREIIWVMKELNKKGYLTKYSCAGHKKDEYGYVMFKNNLKMKDRPEVEQILQKHGLKSITFPERRREIVHFKPVGAN